MNKLPKVVTRSKKRRGQGGGSGKGFHTVGRGQKGQKARGSVNILFEGMKVKKSLIHRLPFLRGKLKNKAHPKSEVISLEKLNTLANGTKVTVDSLVSAKLVSDRALKYGVKVLGPGKLDKKLEVSLQVSASAQKAIEAAGGKLV
ncbi:50S ribosomal protein L15 [Candidatus Microgenomates bacterium]|nr:50S ribosomal protein L15 [Candidatus Microgenomates bacterium]